MTAKTYLIGREPDPSQPRIVLGDKSVSRNHGTISPAGNGSYTLTDAGSANGTYVRERGGWRRIETAHVGHGDEVRLGMYVTTIAALLQGAIETPGRVRMERNPETGEIIPRK